MKKKRKQRRKYSPKIASIRLLGAVGDWVNANGGNALVAGSIGLLFSDHPSMGIFSEGLDSRASTWSSRSLASGPSRKRAK